MVRTMTILGAGLIGLMHPTASHAGPLDFMFSFSNTVGNVNGTVTGEIFGLTNNTANQAASNVVVDSAPALLGLPAFPSPLPIFTDVTANSFTVLNGAITDASFASGDPLHNQFSITLNFNLINFFGNNDSHAEIQNDDGFAGATYTPVTVPAPLLATGPVAASVTLLATGLATLWPFRRRLRRRATSA
jgi:hypothetical protein